MTKIELLERLSSIKEEAQKVMATLKSEKEAVNCKVRFLGRKGLLTALLKDMSQLDAAERPEIGKRANEIKLLLENELEVVFESVKKHQVAAELSGSKIDVTLPGRYVHPGRLHPITRVMAEIKSTFMGLGFSIYEGPEVESDYYNFEALNVPKDHPARDMQDTFYISDDYVLRTHTSPIQIRVMEKFKPPIRMIFPGAVYRCDADVSHSPMFHQVEGLMVDTHITLGDLKGVLAEFIHRMFGKDADVRFRPSFFPFTEPSAEVDVQCVICRGKARLSDGRPCRLCKETGWLEILGSGMVDPAVFKAVKYNPKKVTGFAFGMGVERIAMLKYGINDIRLFFENDLRFLKQF